VVTDHQVALLYPFQKLVRYWFSRYESIITSFLV